MSARTVLEELARDDLSPDHVQARVADWAAWITQLYQTIIGWLPDGWRAALVLNRNAGAGSADALLMNHYGNRNRIAHGTVQATRLDLRAAVNCE